MLYTENVFRDLYMKRVYWFDFACDKTVLLGKPRGLNERPGAEGQFLYILDRKQQIYGVIGINARTRFLTNRDINKEHKCPTSKPQRGKYGRKSLSWGHQAVFRWSVGRKDVIPSHLNFSEQPYGSFRIRKIRSWWYYLHIFITLLPHTLQWLVQNISLPADPERYPAQWDARLKLSSLENPS